MTPQEFKAWFDGFTEAMEGIPNEPQWEKIKARVAEIDGNTVTYPVFLARYWPHPYYYSSPSYGYYGPHALSMNAQCAGGNDSGASLQTYVQSSNFDSRVALYAAGQTDAADMGGNQLPT